MFSVTATGLQPVIDKCLPLLQAALRGEWIAAIPGVQFKIPDGANITVTGRPDGKADINGLGVPICIDPAELMQRIFPCHSRNEGLLTGVTVDPAGMEARANGFLIPSVYLKAG